MWTADISLGAIPQNNRLAIIFVLLVTVLLYYISNRIREQRVGWPVHNHKFEMLILACRNLRVLPEKTIVSRLSNYVPDGHLASTGS